MYIPHLEPGSPDSAFRTSQAQIIYKPKYSCNLTVPLFMWLTVMKLVSIVFIGKLCELTRMVTVEEEMFLIKQMCVVWIDNFKYR